MTRVVAGLVVAVAIAVIAFHVWFLRSSGAFAIIPIALTPFALVGALLIVRVPGNAVGWLLSGSGVLFGLNFLFGGYAWIALIDYPGRLPGGEVAAAAYAMIGFVPGLAVAVLMLLFFPSGHGLGGRWTWPERGVMAFLVLVLVLTFLKDEPAQLGPVDTGLVIAKPFSLGGPLGALVALLAPLSGPATLPIALFGPASLFIRYRRSSAVEREQIKWLAYSGTLALLFLVASSLTPDGNNGLFLVGLALLGTLPVAIAIAVLRYRLYDIDVLIRRTVVYGATTLTLAALFFGGVLFIQALLRPFTQGNELAVAASTLGSLALFGPLRRRVQTLVDRRFYRSRYDAARTVDDFSARLRDEVDLDALRADLVRTAADAMQPAHAGVWLRERIR